MTADLILVGGGLANCLIAWRLRQLRPDLRLLLLERDATLGGNHTWSFHGTDIAPAQLAWLRPLLAASWPGHEIIFPERRRRLKGSYHSLLAEDLHRAVLAQLGAAVMLGAEVREVAPTGVRLADGRAFTAPAVVDGRGDPGNRHLNVGFQKFLGLLVETEADSGLDVPVLMDAGVTQQDGFRFMYTLPFGPRRLLIEDTRYSNTPALDHEPMRAAIHDYARARGWRIKRVLREETGALPVVLGGNLRAFWQAAPEVPRAGLRAGLFHYTTGYSLPEAVRLADDLAGLPVLRSAELAPRIRRRSFRLWRRGRYFRLLNRMLFLAGPPEQRYRVLQHFYRLPEELVNRFYAGDLTWADRLRIVSGRPPVPVGRALGSLLAGSRRALPARPAAGERS